MLDQHFIEEKAAASGLPADEIYDKTARIIRATYSRLPQHEREVLDILTLRWARPHPARCATQDEIARQLPSLGSHLKDRVDNRKKESTLRQVRQLVRNLRVEWGVPVCSSDEGYFLPLTRRDADEYLQRVEREARARAASSFETYRCVARALGVRSTLFEVLEQGEKFLNERSTMFDAFKKAEGD